MKKEEPPLFWGVYSTYTRAGRSPCLGTSRAGAQPHCPHIQAAQLGAHRPPTLVRHHDGWWRRVPTQGPVLAEWCQPLPPPPPETLYFRGCPDPPLITSVVNKQPNTPQTRGYTWHNQRLHKNPTDCPAGIAGDDVPTSTPALGWFPPWGTGPRGIS